MADQIAQALDQAFQKALEVCQAKKNLWEKVRQVFDLLPLHIYPNPVPVGDVLYFEDMPEGNSNISLIDPLGKVVFAAELMGNSVRLPSALAVGVYLLQWTGEKGAKRWGKV